MAKIKRTNNTQLASFEELQEIFKKEAKRPIPPAKQNIHYPQFDAFASLLRHFSLPCEWLASDLGAKDLTERAVNGVEQVLSGLALAMLELPANKRPINLYNAVYEYLGEDDPLEPADLIFVFGSLSLFRAEKAVELYKKGLAPRILFTGSGPHWQKPEQAEAQRYAAFARKQGIPSNAILAEDLSITVADNVCRGLNLLDDKKILYQSVILVNAPYPQRRGWCHFRKHTMDSIKIMRANALMPEGIQKENWFTNEKGIRLYCNEFVKMKTAVILNTA